jgi:hypothetical protein
MIRNLILKWCITTQMEVKALCVETEEDVWWLSQKKTVGNSARFNAVDGLHHATIKDDGIVSLQMIDVLNIKRSRLYFSGYGFSTSCSDSGGFRNYNVKEQGSAIRYSELYGKQGSNINFVKKIDANTFRCAPMKEAWKMKHWLVERVRPLLQ